ncbi:MAG TPA: histidine kinase [Thermoanaerobaculia bacterium]|jgi:two-component sensor histidine kinase
MNLLGRPLKTAAAILAGWTFFHLFFLTEAAIRSDERDIPFSFEQLAIANALTVIIWMLLTPFFVYAVSRIDLPRHWTLGRTLLVVLAVLIFSGSRSLIGGAAGLAIEGVPLIPQELWKAFVTRMFGNTFAAGCCAALLLLNDYRGAAREREQLNAKLTEANLAQLKAQLRPHFLFNTLNTIATLVHTDPKTADEMITSLSELLRASFELGDRQEITLGEELGFVRSYLAIQEARFRDRLRVEIDVDEAVLASSVPTFFLQPLVENAIQHSIAPRRHGGKVTIRARRERGTLRIDVHDDGSSFDASRVGAGVGLSNTLARLQALYGSAQHVDFRKDADGLTIEIHIPMRLVAAA